MKKLLLLLVAMTALVFTGCKEKSNEPAVGIVVYENTTSNIGSVKTYEIKDGKDVYIAQDAVYGRRKVSRVLPVGRYKADYFVGAFDCVKKFTIKEGEYTYVSISYSEND